MRTRTHAGALAKRAPGRGKKTKASVSIGRNEIECFRLLNLQEARATAAAVAPVPMTGSLPRRSPLFTYILRFAGARVAPQPIRRPRRISPRSAFVRLVFSSALGRAPRRIDPAGRRRRPLDGAKLEKRLFSNVYVPVFPFLFRCSAGRSDYIYIYIYTQHGRRAMRFMYSPSLLIFIYLLGSSERRRTPIDEAVDDEGHASRSNSMFSLQSRSLAEISRPLFDARRPFSERPIDGGKRGARPSRANKAPGAPDVSPAGQSLTDEALDSYVPRTRANISCELCTARNFHLVCLRYSLFSQINTPTFSVNVFPLRCFLRPCAPFARSSLSDGALAIGRQLPVKISVNRRGRLNEAGRRRQTRARTSSAQAERKNGPRQAVRFRRGAPSGPSVAHKGPFLPSAASFASPPPSMRIRRAALSAREPARKTYKTVRRVRHNGAENVKKGAVERINPFRFIAPHHIARLLCTQARTTTGGSSRPS